MGDEEREVVNLFKEKVKIDEKQREKEIRKQIRLYQEEHKKNYGSKQRSKPLINRFSSKLKITL